MNLFISRNDKSYSFIVWTSFVVDIKYIPLQANEGDDAIFLRESAVEIEFEEKKYLIVSHSAILALVRIEITEATSET